MSDANKSNLVRYRWVILIISMLAGFIGSYAQFQLPALAYKLIPNLNLSSSQFAALMSGPMTGSLFLCILGGALADRFGVKKVVAAGLVLSVIGCTFRYAVTSFWPFLIMTVLAGLASGLLIGNLAKLFGAWFPPEQMGTIMTFSSFLPNVLRDLWSINEKTANWYGSLPTFGGIFGCFLGPMLCNRIGFMKPYLIVVGLLGAVATFWSWQMPIGSAIVVALIVAGFIQYSVQPLISALPMLLPEIGPVYAGSAGGIIATIQVLGAVVLPTFVITPLAGSNVTMLFGLAALSMALMIIPASLLPELGRRALEARGGSKQ